MVGSYRLRSQLLLFWCACGILGIFSIVSSEKLRDFGAEHFILHSDFDKSKNPILESAHNILHNRDETPLEVPLDIHVILVGFNGDGGYRYELDESSFQVFLQGSCHSRRPSCLETGEQLKILHALIMKVTKASTASLLELEKAVKSAMVLAGARKIAGADAQTTLYEVEATTLEPILDRMYGSMFGGAAHPTDEKLKGTQAHPAAIFILNLDKVRMDPTKQGHPADAPGYRPGRLSREDVEKQDGGYAYHYRYMGSSPTQAWIGAGRYLVVDVSSGPCTFGRLGADRGLVVPGTVPRLSKAILPILKSHPDTYVEHTQKYVQAQLSGVVASAVDHVIAPDVNFEVLDINSRVLVSVVVLQNHHHFHPLKPGHSHFLNLTLVREEVHKLVPPDQEVMVVGGMHALDEHEHIAIAVEKALRWRATATKKPSLHFQAEQKPYLDGAVLMDELRHSTDMLAAGLLDATEPDLANTFFYTMMDEEGLDSSEDSGNNKHVKAGTRYTPLDFSRRERQARYKAALANPRPPTPMRKDGSRVSRMHGTRVIPVFVLSLAGVHEGLLMDGETALEIAHDGVIVLQVVNGTTPIGFVSEGHPQTAQTSDPTRDVLAGVASVLGSLAPPWARVAPLRTAHRPGQPSSPGDRASGGSGGSGGGSGQPGVVEEWLWASGHHPFGPFSNCSGFSQLLIDNSHRNAIYSTVDVALHGVRESLDALQAYADKYFITPLGSPVNQPGANGRVRANIPWLDQLYKRNNNENDDSMPRILSHDIIKEIEDMLDQVESELGRIGQKLQNYDMDDAHTVAESLLETARNFHSYVILSLDETSDSLRCCSMKHRKPRRVSNAVLYAGILAAGFVVYFLVICFSSPER